MSDRYQTYWISRRIFWIQGLYYAVTGIWPLLHLSSFLAVTGPKQDIWLVQTVGALIAILGVSLCVAGRIRVPNAANYVLAAGSATVLMLVDVIFTAAGAISAIYLLDAFAELLLLVAWITVGIFAWRERRGTDLRHSHHLAMALR